MNPPSPDDRQAPVPGPDNPPPSPDSVCPVCGGPLISEKCKVICRSDRCRYRIVFNCAEF